MVTPEWKPFPYDAAGYRYEGAALERAWPELHRGDREPYPDAAFVKKAFARRPKLARGLDADKTAAALQSATSPPRSPKAPRSVRSAPTRPPRRPTSTRPISNRTGSGSGRSFSNRRSAPRRCRRRPRIS